MLRFQFQHDGYPEMSLRCPACGVAAKSMVEGCEHLAGAYSSLTDEFYFPETDLGERMNDMYMDFHWQWIADGKNFDIVDLLAEVEVHDLVPASDPPNDQVVMLSVETATADPCASDNLVDSYIFYWPWSSLDTALKELDPTRVRK